MVAAAHLTTLPVIKDDSDYCLTCRDFDFLRLSDQDVVNCSIGVAPLGMTPESYKEFVRSLAYHLWRESAPVSVDVRIQGSSTHFFSGKHKRMPYRREDIAQEYMLAHSDYSPPPNKLRSLEEAVQNQWPDSEPRPQQRPFDSLYRLGIHVEPSDYDVQISCDALVQKIKDALVYLGLRPDVFEYKKKVYRFVRRELVREHLRYLAAWEDKATVLTGRTVSIALFGSGGPPKVRASAKNPNPMSSHFQDSDWIVPLPHFRRGG